MSAEFNLKDVKGMIRRRAKVFLISFLLVFFVGLSVAFYLPPVYRSEATIVIESQEIPEDYVKSTITTYVQQRLQIISQAVMSRVKLNEMIQEYNLYADLDPADKLAQMRKDINLETTDLTLQDERTGRLKIIADSVQAVLRRQRSGNGRQDRHAADQSVYRGRFPITQGLCGNDSRFF